MLIYLLLLFFIIFLRQYQITCRAVLNAEHKLVKSEESGDKLFLFVSFGLIILLTALRSENVGPDTRQYIGHFNRICNDVYYRLDEQFESGYWLLTVAVSKITYNEQIFLLVIALMTNIPIALFINKYSRNKLLSVVLYITVGAFTFQLTGLRQSIAMAICIMAIDYSLQRKLLPFLFLTVLASFFHRSAILFLPVYLVGTPILNRRNIILIVASFIFVTFADIFISNLSMLLSYGEYLGTAGVEDTGGWTVIAIMLISLVLYLFTKKSGSLGEREDNNDRFFFILLLWALSLYWIRYQMRAAERVSLYYRCALLILLPNTLDRLQNKNLRTLLNSACIVLAILLFFYWLQGSAYIYTPFWAP